jgi:GDP-L-fucose synthase
VITVPSTELDLRDKDSVRDFVLGHKPDYLVIAAARVGGIWANSNFPVEFLTDNLEIQNNLMLAAHEAKTPHLVFLGSSCIYPKFAPQPLTEDSLLTGPLEPTNDAYAIAKIAGVRLVRAFRQEHGHDWYSLMPTNLYGPFDNFDLKTSHVLPALLRRFHEAKVDGSSEVTLWGTGSPRREFLHVDDLASAIWFLANQPPNTDLLNVGYGADQTIKDTAELAQRITGFSGSISWDTTMPDGTPQKLLDSARIFAMGWRPNIDLSTGLTTTYQWYLDNP